MIRLAIKPNKIFSLYVDEIFWGELEIKAFDGKRVMNGFNESVHGKSFHIDYAKFDLRFELNYFDGLIEIKKKIIPKVVGEYSVETYFFPKLVKITDWGVPAVFYKNNVHGHGNYPRGSYKTGWSFREDRSSIPGCSWLLDELKNWSGIFVLSSLKEELLMSTETGEANESPYFMVRFPSKEAPKSFLEKGIIVGGQYSQKLKKWQVNDLDQIIEKRIFVSIGKSMEEDQILEKLYFYSRQIHQSHQTNKSINWTDVVFKKFNHLKYLTKKFDGRTHLMAGKDNGIIQPIFNYTAGSFLVRAMDGAWEFALAGKELENQDLVNLGEGIGDFFQEGSLPNGLHQDNFGFYKNKFGGYIVPLTPDQYKQGCNTRCNGEAFYGYLQLYKILKNEAYLNLVKKGLDFYKENQLENGSFGRWWSKEGKVLNSEGTNGAHLILAFVEYQKITNSHDYDQALLKAKNFYANLIKNQEYYGDTLDADCMDKEAGVILMRSFLALYEHDQKSESLELAFQAARFVLSWIWTYNVCWPENSLASEQNVKTVGLTSVSVDHHHLDFYGYLMAYDFLKLAKYSGDQKWKDVGLDLLYSCAQLIADESNNYLGKDKNLLGWQPEQINHTTWDYFNHFFRSKGAFHNVIAWPATLSFHGLFKIRENFPEVLNFKLKQ